MQAVKDWLLEHNEKPTVRARHAARACPPPSSQLPCVTPVGLHVALRVQDGSMHAEMMRQIRIQEEAAAAVAAAEEAKLEVRALRAGCCTPARQCPAADQRETIVCQFCVCPGRARPSASVRTTS